MMTDSQRAVDLVRYFFASLGRRNVDAVTALWHEDGHVSAAFNASGDTSDEAIRTAPHALFLASFLKNYDQIAFLDIKTSATQDGAIVWAETRGQLRVAATGTPYCNRYVFKFTFEAGRIKQLVEYANTVTQNLYGHSAVTKK
jgi:ketosteroid isomerase-like protein